MRRITAMQALKCETSGSRRCQCRCGGLLHGINVKIGENGREQDESCLDPVAVAAAVERHTAAIQARLRL